MRPLTLVAQVIILVALGLTSACAPASLPATTVPATAAPTRAGVMPSPIPLSSSGTAVTIALGAPTGAALKPLLGVNIGPGPAGEAGNADLTSAYQRIGVNLIRTHDYYGPLDMSQMYPDRTRDPSKPEVYNLAQSDATWKKIVDNGFEPYLRLGDSWNNAQPPANAAERANWVKAAVEVIRHYRAGKWNGFNTAFRYVEIWNEPDNEQFWQKPRTRLEFFQLYAETASALKQAFPDLKVGGPGLTPGGALSSQGQQYTQAFLDYVQSQRAPLDFFSWHVYSNDPNAFVTSAQFYRAQLDARGFKSAESHITEWNTEAESQRVNTPEEARQVRVGSRGAAILTSAWIGLQQNKVDVSTFYRGPDPSLNAPTFYGLFFANGVPKRNGHAFSLWKQMVEHPKRVSMTLTPADSGLWTLAGQNDPGEITLLLANPTDKAYTWTLGNASRRSMTVQQISDASEQLQSLSPALAAIEIGAYTVQLATIKR